MNQKALRLCLLALIALLALSPFHALFPAHAFVQSLFVPPSTIFGLGFVCVLWFAYFSNYRYAREALLIQGVVSLIGTGWILASYLLGLHIPFEKLLIGPHSAFLLNLTYMFMAGYLIQILYYWLPRTKVLINISLAVILFMTLLSILGHIYSFHGINQEPLLLPAPLGAILTYLVLTLIIFIHTNRMERLYLPVRVMAGFALMFTAVVLANIVIYTNVSRTVNLSSELTDTRSTLTAAYNMDFYLDNAQEETQAYQASGDTDHIAAYASDKTAYLRALVRVQQHTNIGIGTASVSQSVASVASLGKQILATGDRVIAQKHPKPVAMLPASESAMDQVHGQIKYIVAAYTSQLNRLTQRESQDDRGLVLGISIASALSMLMILFTPLFIRQTIRRLSLTEGALKNSNKLLSEETSRVEAILASIGDGLFAVNMQGVITVFNQAAEDISGVRQTSALGRSYEEVMHFVPLSSSGTMLDFTARALQGTPSYLSHNAVLRRPGGKTVDVQVSASPVKNKAGAVMGAIVVFRDRSSEQALENAKDEFVSLASHQLRTPATATKQFLAMFLQGYAGHIDDKQRLYLQQAYDNNELGINIIEDLLNITRLESNRLKVVKEDVELAGFLRDSVEQHRAFAERGKQTLDLVTPQKQVHLTTDRNLLAMAVDNLLTNALKYSDEGSTVTIRLTAGKRIAIAVSDQGIGIKQEDMSKIFQRFSRLEDPQKQYVSGTGIGLYLIKKIVKQLHATIKAESEYGKGSTFTIEFKSME